MLTISCPACKRPISVDASLSGQKFACPHCGQRLQVPIPPTPPEPPSAQKTMLATFQSAADLPTSPALLVAAPAPSAITAPPPFIPPPQPTGPPPPTPEMRRMASWRCFMCGSTARPRVEKAMSQQGLTVLLVMLLVFFPLFWIGLLIQEEFFVCQHCGAKTKRG